MNWSTRIMFRGGCAGTAQYLQELGDEQLQARRAAVDAAIVTMGITFTIYSDGENIDRPWPFDPIPRIMTGTEWWRIERGLKQRLTALNLFIDDLYNAQRWFGDKVFPAELLASSRNFRKNCTGVPPRFGVWAHICGTDLVRDRDGTVTSRRQSAGALGRVLHAREPPLDEELPSGAFRGMPYPSN